MKALIIGLNYDPEPTGIAPYTSALCRGLQAHGHQVRAITAMPHYPHWRIHEQYRGWSRRETVDGIPVRRLRHYVPRRPSLVLRLISECTFGLRVALTRWGAPDIVVFVSPALFASAIAILGRLPRQPFVVWVQDIYSLGLTETRHGPTRLAVWAIRALESLLLRQATGVVIIHRRFESVVAHFGVPQDRMKVVRNWTHLPRRTTVDRNETRAKLSWPDDRTVALHSGAMGVKQDLENVVEAARLGEQAGAPVRFVLSGTGSERERLERLASGLATIEFSDPLPRDEFQDQLAAADVLLVNEHRGLREMAVPSKLTSYFSSGRPIIAATSSGSVTAEEVEASGAGIRVEPGEPSRLLQAVLEMSQDASVASRLGAAGRRYQEEVLSEDVALGDYVQWLEGLAERFRQRSPLARLRRNH